MIHASLDRPSSGNMDWVVVVEQLAMVSMVGLERPKELMAVAGPGQPKESMVMADGQGQEWLPSRLLWSWKYVLAWDMESMQSLGAMEDGLALRPHSMRNDVGKVDGARRFATNGVPRCGQVSGTVSACSGQ